MRCYRCGRPFDPEIFARDRSKASGFKSLCKPCDSAKGRQYYRDNADRIRPIARERERRRRKERKC